MLFLHGIRSDVNRLMQAMDVFVFPSLYEGLPVTMIEAQASGMQCIISDRVSKECIVTKGLVIRKRLSDSVENWANYILRNQKKRMRSILEKSQMPGMILV